MFGTYHMKLIYLVYSKFNKSNMTYFMYGMKHLENSTAMIYQLYVKKV